jgi:response regulator RpfG family c-di-GMP phosphodiesterase
MKKILIADKDESLKDAFRVVFPSDEYEIIFTPNGREVEKIVEEYRPEIYIINSKLEKKDGTDVYKDMREKNMLQNVRFFFMKDEGTESDLSDYLIDGVIEKPINFFRVHQMIDKEDALPELKIARKPEENIIQATKSYSHTPKENTTVLEIELKKILYDSIENMKMSIVDRMTPVISQYMEENAKKILNDAAEKVIEENAKKILNDAAEKVIRNEMDKLLSLLRESRR